MFGPLDELFVQEGREARLPAAYYRGKLVCVVSTKVEIVTLWGVTHSQDVPFVVPQ